MNPLPIDAALPEILDRLAASRALVLVAEPGAGKTTRVPPALVASNLLTKEHPGVVLLQPRRVAARTVAARIADERGWTLGEEVGYQVRFERKISKRTRLQVLTEGILTRRLVADPFLEGVGAIILDEFHERSLHTDLALALAREARDAVREDLILIVMSATLDANPVSTFLGGAPIVRVPGRTHPVEIRYRANEGAHLPERAASAIRELVETPRTETDRADLLVFLPGVEEIRRTARSIESLASDHQLAILPLHGSLPAEEQDRALRPNPLRKVVLATNIAETSLTIDGVTAVVDSGLARVAGHDAARGLDRLELRRISRASATQRAGRAGRTRPGVCVRLWPERETRGMIDQDVPEIKRVDLAGTVLALHAWGHPDPATFGWFESPEPARLQAAETLLVRLGAIDGPGGSMTPLGRQILEIPAHPRLARLLIAAHASGLTHEGATLAALLSEKDICTREWSSRDRGDSDLLVRLDLMRAIERDRFAHHWRDRGVEPNAARRVAQVRDDLIRITRRWPVDSRAVQDEDALLKLVLLAYPDRVVRQRGEGGAGVMVGGRGVRLDGSSVVQEANYYVAIDPHEDRRKGTLEARVKIASRVERDWLDELFPGAVKRERSVEFDEERRAVVGVVTTRFLDLTLEENRNVPVDPEAGSIVLAEAVRPRVLDLINEEARTWLARYGLLTRAMPETNLPEIDDAFWNDVLTAAARGRRLESDLVQAPWVMLLKSKLNYAQSRLMDEQTPEALAVPSGNRIKLTYEDGRPPVLAVRLQELFGWTDTPRIAGGRVPVLLHLLGPNYRPVQITEDLRSFWSGTYFQVRKDLRSRYPKHSWPEDPLTAKAEARGGRRSH